MPESSPESGDFTRPARSRWAWGAAVGAVALAWFACGLPSESHFVDESAYFSQTYYADLLLSGDLRNAAWLEYPAYDLPPLPKYLIGSALALGGYKRPGPDAARRWYRNTSSRFESPGALDAARVPSAILGAIGCVAVYALGLQLRDVKTGVLAALLLMFNPLYGVHARRAMSDVPAEAFILVALALGLSAWRRALEGRVTPSTWSLAVNAGVSAGLAALCKLNGALAMIVLIAWGALALALPGVPASRKARVVSLVVIAGAMSLLTFTILNPFLTAQPKRTTTPETAAVARMNLWQRARLLVKHRVAVSSGQQELFPHNAVPGAADKLRVVAVQGFGRFGPFGPTHDDSTRRYEMHQDWGAAIWLPWVAAGAGWACTYGRKQWRERTAPTGWAILVQAVVSLIVVTAYLPLAWNRYFLSIQAGSALLASGIAVAGAERFLRGVRLPGQGT